MQVRIREEFDADIHAEASRISDVKTAEFPYEINCIVCNRAYFIDQGAREKMEERIGKGLDNDFLCVDCQQESDALAYEAR